MFVTAGLVAAALAVGGPLVANAVPAPTITLSATTASPYGQFTATSGAGFSAGAPLTFLLDGTNVSNQLVGPLQADATGSFSAPFGWQHFTTPGGGSLGKHTLLVTDGVTHLSASADITVVATPTPTPAQARLTVSQITGPGLKVTFSGFTPGDSVDVGMYNRDSGFGGTCATVTADVGGVATAICNWNAAYVTHFKLGNGIAPGPGVYGLGANNATYSIYSAEMTVTVGDPIVAKPAAPATHAAPATPVRGPATFTG